jgi:thiosulfate/3-mercaptopyruvate sulfurtransferase
MASPIRAGHDCSDKPGKQKMHAGQASSENTMHSTLIEASELATRVDRPDWAIVDCRFDLTRPEWGASAYAAAHIPNAVYANLDRDLSGPVGPHTGRHPLPSREALSGALSRLGIDATTQVVAYDQGNGAYAARLWWLLRWSGHAAVAVLNGGFAAWNDAGLPVTHAVVTRPTRRFSMAAEQTGVVDTAELERMIGGGELSGGHSALVDARGADRFAGDNETLDPVAGHVPGARNHPFAGNLDARGRFLDAGELRRRWQQTLGTTPPEKLVSMCGSGVTACHNLLALEVAGLGGARLYAGSWSEWIRDPSRPVARGSANRQDF